MNALQPIVDTDKVDVQVFVWKTKMFSAHNRNMQQMSDLRGLPHVFMFVCVLWADADVSAAADITQLSQRHTHCSRHHGRLHAFAEKENELTFFKTGPWGKCGTMYLHQKTGVFLRDPKLGSPSFPQQSCKLFPPPDLWL